MAPSIPGLAKDLMSAIGDYKMNSDLIANGKLLFSDKDKKIARQASGVVDYVGLLAQWDLYSASNDEIIANVRVLSSRDSNGS